VQPWGFVLVRSAERLAGPYLTGLQATIRAERFGNKSDQELRDVLNELCLQYAAELGTRQAEPRKVEEGRA
jgi:hypothetical protein